MSDRILIALISGGATVAVALITLLGVLLQKVGQVHRVVNSNLAAALVKIDNLESKVVGLQQALIHRAEEKGA